MQKKNHLFLNSFLCIYQIFDNGRFPDASKKAAIEELLLQETGKQFPRSYRASPELFGDIRAPTVMENIEKMEKVLQNKGKRGCPRIAQEFCRIAREAGRQLFGSRFGAAGVPFWRISGSCPGAFSDLSGRSSGIFRESLWSCRGGGEILTSSIVLCFLLLFCIVSSICLSGGPGALRSCPEASPGRLPSLYPRPLKYIFGNNFEASLRGNMENMKQITKT